LGYAESGKYYKVAINVIRIIRRGNMDDDGRDKLEELTCAQVKRYVEQRVKRGELAYNNGSIITPFPRFIDRLAAPRKYPHNKKPPELPPPPKPDEGFGIIDEHQLYSAIAISLLHDAALCKLDIATLGEFSHWFEWGGGPGQSETIYHRVMRNLLRPYSSMVERLCFQPVRESDHGWIIARAVEIRTAFNELGKELSYQRKHLRQQMEDEAGLSFDEVCRQRYDAFLMRRQLEK
jgi:hypothetical protein